MSRDKELEQAYMVLKDEYAELALAIFPGLQVDKWFGDPLLGHKELIKEVKKYLQDSRGYY